METDLDNYEPSPADIAIVGMAVRVAGARSTEQFWQNVRDGVVSIGDVLLSDEELVAAGVSPADLRNPDFVRRAGRIEDVEAFDAGFFGIGARDAAIMDPQHRHFLECVWESLENAGYPPETFGGAIGVYAGCGMNEYMMTNLLSNQSLVDSLGMFLLRHTQNDKDFLSSGISYRLDLKGPSLSVQTACSTSLVAVHLAVQGLLGGECDLAIAGGVTIQVPHGAGYLYREGEVLSPDGVCRPFDVASNGTVLTSGVGVVVLKTLQSAIKDGDNIRAVIKASAINNDGSHKVSYLAPSVDGQAAVVAEALSLGDIPADSIQYVEAHGTGTAVGDPIELAALTQAFRASTDEQNFCRIGSAKANIGHTDTAAGVIGLIKATLALENRTFPPLANFSGPNPRISLDGSPFIIRTEAEAWERKGGLRRAGVSSLGVGGTNAHVVLEEAPPAKPSTASTQPWQVLPLSAKSEAALDALTASLAESLEKDPSRELADVAYTLQSGRTEFEHRRAVVASTSEDAVKVLRGEEKRRLVAGKHTGESTQVTFLFPGGGTSYPNMGRELYDTQPVYRGHVDECLAVLERLEMDISNVLYPEPAQLEEATAEMAKMRFALPATFITEYAMAKLLMHFGIEPAAMSGHSLGEYAAACLAGVLSLEDALGMVVERSLLLDSVAGGSMLSVTMPEDELRQILPADVSLATINAPELCVVSGTDEAICSFEELLKSRDITAQRVPISAAAHSHLLDPILDRFRTRLQNVRFQAPQRPFISNVTGTWVDADAVRTPEYWVGHLRNTVRFSAGMTELLSDPTRIYIEVGPGQTLATLARHQSSRPRLTLTTMGPPERTRSETEFFLMTLARLWAEGVKVDWDAMRDGEERRRVALPTYPFERKRYWIDPAPRAASKAGDLLAKIPDISNWFSRPVWKRSEAALLAAPAERQRWLLFLDEQGVGARLARSLIGAGHEVFRVSHGSRFRKSRARQYTILASSKNDHDLLLADIAAEGGLPGQVVHLWGVTDPRRRSSLEAGLEVALQHEFASPFYLAQAIGAQDSEQRLTLSVVTNGLQSVAGEPVLSPEKALMMGPVQAIPAEFANVTCRSIDLDSFSPNRADALETTVRALTEELAHVPHDSNLAIRDGQIWTLTHEPVVVEAEDSGRTYLRQGGVYLITGGLGTLGLGLAAHLATHYGAKLVLTGRSTPPPRHEWDTWLAHHEASDPTSLQMKTLMQIEADAAGLMVRSADVTNGADLDALVKEAVAQFGGIDGVFHAAGVLDDALIQSKSMEQAAAVLAPKVQGTLALYAALSEVKPDFLILFSSSSALLSIPGQVDYAAANAFENAFAASKAGTSEPEVIAIDWGLWASAAERRTASPAASHNREALDGPLFTSVAAKDDGGLIFAGALSPAQQWLLDEHRLKNGSPVMPGTGYFELALTGARRALNGSAAELHNIFFASPFAVADGETKEIQLSLTPQADAWVLEIDSAAGDASHRSSHATGSVAALQDAAPPLSDLGFAGLDVASNAIKNGETGLTQASTIRFGPRWHSVRSQVRDGDKAGALLALDKAFSGDAGRYHLHPALLDVTVGLGLSLLPQSVAGDSLYVPMGCSRVRVWGDVPARVHSYARLAGPVAADARVVSLDLVITDEDGNVLVEAKDFSLKRLSAQEASEFGQGNLAETEARSSEQSRKTDTSDLPPLLALARTDGIRLEEGLDALERVLARWRLPQVVVSSLPLEAIQRLLSKGSGHGDGSESAVQRPELATEYEAPRDEVEKFLVQAWQEFLGIDKVGISDDFFDLGGHSLIAVRVFARVKKQYGIELPLASLFNAPTVSALAAVLRANLGLVLSTGAAPASESAAPSPARDTWSSLVPIQEKGLNPPLFCVHGMAGNVLNFRDISMALGPDQPFYGLQARGLNGIDEPYDTFEEMAALYISEIRAVQPHGPYYLGGFSGGGVVAFEMGRQLQAAGEEVALLACFDSICPTLMRRRSKLGRVKTLLSGLAHGRGDYISFLLQRRKAVQQASASVDSSVEDAGVLESERIERDIENAFIAAQEKYEVEPLDAEMALFQAQDRSEIALSYIPNDFGWTGFVRRVSVTVVPGKHTSLVLEPNVRILAAGLKTSIEAAKKRTKDLAAAK